MFRFGNRRCLDPESLYLDCKEFDIPTGHWYGKANTWRVVAGEKPSSGKLLMMQSSLDELDTTKSFTLEIEDDYGNNHQFKNVFIVGAVCVVPGTADAGANVFLVDVADARCRLAMLPIDRGYNVRTPDGSSLTTVTTDAGTPWTWTTMLEDVWGLAGLGTWPGTLPVTPHGQPENIGCYGDYALRCLVALLNRIGCELQPIGDGFFRIVQQGTTAATRWPNSRRTYDGYSRRSDSAQKPEKIRVRFARMPAPTDGTSPYYTVDVSTAATSGVLTGSVVHLDDDLPALGGSTPSNVTDLNARATERAADWERLYDNYEKPEVKVYHEYVRGSGVDVGVRYGAMVYEDRGQASATEGLVRPGNLNYTPLLLMETSGQADRYMGLCHIRSSYGVITGSRETWVRPDGSSYCREVPDCPDGGCSVLWWCDGEGNVFSAPVGPRPENAVGEPSATEAEAYEDCFAILESVGQCDGCNFKAKSRYILSMENGTGIWAGKETAIITNPYMDSSNTNGLGDVLMFPYYLFSIESNPFTYVGMPPGVTHYTFTFTLMVTRVCNITEVQFQCFNFVKEHPSGTTGGGSEGVQVIRYPCGDLIFPEKTFVKALDGWEYPGVGDHRGSFNLYIR